MSRRPTSLLAASTLNVREDRLTDLLACCINRSPDLGRAIFRLAKINADPVSVKAITQAWTQGGRRVDMELVGRDIHGSERCRVWAEHKTGAGYQDLQLEDYAENLRHYANSRLITVVEKASDAPSGDDWEVVTWSAVAASIVGILRRRLGLGWRRRALDPTDQEVGLELASLAELLIYLREEHHVVSEPLTTSDIVAFATFANAFETLDALLNRSAELSSASGPGPSGWTDDGSQAWVSFASAASDWWTPYGGYPEIHLADRDFFGSARRGEPAFGVGITVPGKFADELHSTHKAWVAKMKNAGIEPLAEDAYLRAYGTVYLAEVLIAGVTLDEQAEFIAARLDAALDLIRQHVPATALRPDLKRGRNRRGIAQSDDASADDA